MTPTIILITGANSGIGFATSKVLALTSDAFHVIMAGRSLDKVEEAITEIKKENKIVGSLSAIQLDVTDEKSAEDAAAHVQQQFGQLDVLVNNAGVGGLGQDLKTAFTGCMTTNVMGPALVSEAFRPLLLKSKNPYSIFVGSGARTQVSKAALNMVALTEYRNFAAEGLKVFVVSPGFVRSNLRGRSEEARSGWGQAGDPDVSGNIILDVIQGKRDADVGGFVHKDGVHPW